MLWNVPHGQQTAGRLVPPAGRHDEVGDDEEAEDAMLGDGEAGGDVEL